MGNKKEKTEKSKVSVNLDNNYICYSHPRKLNDKGHVKQITRSIKGLEESRVESIQKQLNTLLNNFKDKTENFKNIDELKKECDPKIFEWVIDEEVNIYSNRIINSTLDYYIPYPEGDIVYFNSPNSIPINTCIPDNLCNNYCEYSVVSEKGISEYSTVIEFKGFEDLKEDIIERLVLTIKQICNPASEKKFIFPSQYISLEIDINDDFINSVKAINDAYIKEFKIKKNEFKTDYNFNNYVIKRLQNENSDFVDTIYENMTKHIKLNIETCKDFISYKINDMDKVPKILFYKNEDKSEFFDNLDKLFSYNDEEKSLRKLIKSVRIKGEFLDENICYINRATIDSTNVVKFTPNTKIGLENDTNYSFNMLNSLEKSIVFGCTENYNYYTENNIEDKLLNEKLVTMLNQSTLVSNYKNIYALIIECSVKKESYLCETFTTGLLLELYGKYEIFDNFLDLLLESKNNFTKKVDDFFKINEYNYCREENILTMVKEMFLESYIYSLYQHILSPEKLLHYDIIIQHGLIQTYNKFIKEKLNKICTELNSIVEAELTKMFVQLNEVDDYSLYKKSLNKAIVTDIKIPYLYTKELLDDFESRL